MRTTHLLPVLLLTVLGLAGCAAAAPGYMPPRGPDKSNPATAALTKPFDAGTVTAPGIYQVSEAERNLDCRKLTGSMHVIMRRLDDAGNRPVQSQSSQTVQALVAPTTHGKAPLTVTEEVGRERARLKAFNQLLVDKKCKALDIGRYQ